MNEKQTSDMYLAATLVSYGAEIDSVDKADPKRQMFSFKTLPLAVWVIDTKDYVTSQKVSTIAEIKALMVSERLLYPPNFVSAIKSVKSYLYAE